MAKSSSQVQAHDKRHDYSPKYVHFKGELLQEGKIKCDHAFEAKQTRQRAMKLTGSSF